MFRPVPQSKTRGAFGGRRKHNRLKWRIRERRAR